METTVLSEDQLRYWLANEDWYMSRHTREWLDATPPREAGDTLAHIAEGAATEPHALWYRAAATFAAGFSPSGVADPKMGERKAGLRAALMLADLNDFRAIAPLVRVWETDPAWQGKYQERIESGLTRLVSSVSPEQAEQFAPTLRELLLRVWQTGGERRDLSANLADLSSAIVSLLRVAATPENEAALDGLTLVPGTKSRQPNRARVLDAVHPSESAPS